MNISLGLELAARALPSRVAVICGRESLTFSDLWSAARAWGEYFADRTASRVVLIGVNHPSQIAAIYGAALANVDVALLSYRLKPREIERAFEITQPDAVFEWGVRGNDLRLAADSAGLQIHRMSLNGALPEASPITKDVSRPPRRPDPQRAAQVLMFTSGTTHAAKAVVLEQQALMSYLLNAYDAASAPESESTLIATPFHHIAGLMGTLSNIYAARRIVLMQAFDAEDWLRQARQHGVTHAFVVPTMGVQLVNTLETDAELYPDSLKHLAYGGSPSTATQIEALVRTFPSVDLTGAFGLTETSSTVCVLTPEDHRSAMASAGQRGRLGSVGRPIPGVEVIVHQEDTQSQEPASSGEICVRGNQVSKEYIGAGTRVDTDGFFHTGDLGWIDDEGYVFITGRIDDMIQRGAENVAPAEVEAAFLHCPGVRDVAAVGVPDSLYGESVGLAMVLSHSDATDESVFKAWAKEHLPSFRRPTRYMFVREIPRNEQGKVLRTMLRQQFSAESEQAEGELS